MTKEVRDFVIEKTKDLMAAHSCSAEAKAAAQAWLDAAGTDKEPEETARYIEELEADIMLPDYCPVSSKKHLRYQELAGCFALFVSILAFVLR